MIVVFVTFMLFVSETLSFNIYFSSRRGASALRMARGPLRRGNIQPKKKIEPINGYITFPQVRLLMPNEDNPGEDEMLGIVAIEEARERAEEAGVDLVLINENADPPVCKIIDYGKFKYAAEKKKKENAKKQSKVDLKEVKMSYKIEDHDFQVRMRNVQRFIKGGDKVKVIVQFKGREMQYKDLGKDLLFKVYKPLEDTVVMESPPKIEGRAVAMLLGPKKIT